MDKLNKSFYEELEALALEPTEVWIKKLEEAFRSGYRGKRRSSKPTLKLVVSNLNPTKQTCEGESANG